jgi:lipopolysaccharide export system protein LptA
MRRIVLGLVCLALAAPAWAQSLKFQPKDSDKPIDITAPGGLELQQDSKRAIARGTAQEKATLVQGEVSVVADELIADYRADNEIYRVFANGNVTMKSATETATGEAAIYDFDKAVLVLQGETVTLVSNDGSVTAHNVLQYWSNERVAVAEGRASASDSQKREMHGDKLIAFFRDDGPAPAKTAAKTKTKTPTDRGRNDISYVQAFGNVMVQTEKETIRSERGTYNIETNTATLEGNVKITNDRLQSSAGFAVVNMKGGTSRFFGSAAQAGMPGTKENPRVKALIAPKAKPEAIPAPDTAAKPVKQ